MKPFPKEFMWGASTAAYQVEGGLTTQWSEWEKTNAAHQARTAPKKLAWLPHQERIATALADPQNYVAGSGVEHYQRYEEDFDILEQLNMNAFRFGIEWARLEPREGEWDQGAVEHYRRYIRSLKQRGIEPIVTLWHWTMPVWFDAKGGFEKRRNLHYFERFVQKVAEEFGAELRYVLTLNEPNVYTLFSYLTGEWPPQYKRPLLSFAVYRNLAEAHRRAYGIFKITFPNIQIGLAAQLADTRCKNEHNPLNRVVVRIAEYLWNWWFVNRVMHRLDFIGVNYYFTQYLTWRGSLEDPKSPVSDLGWYMEPSGIERLLNHTWKRYGIPILITENGLADSTDEHRQWWLQETIGAMERAQEAGVKMLGYLHWSLLDNFEWAYGWWPKFGLVSVDRHTMQRTVRPSARWFAEQIKRKREHAA